MAVNEAAILQELNASGIGVKKVVDQIGDPIALVFESWHEDKIKIVRDILLKRGSGTVAQSVVALPIERDGDKFTLEISADKVADLLDKGVNGLIQSWGSPFSYKKPSVSPAMVTSIENWNKTTGRTVPVTLSNIKSKKTYTIKTYRELAYATAVNVKQHGIKPSPFMEKAFGKESEKELAQALEKVLGYSVDVHFQEIAKNINKKK